VEGEPVIDQAFDRVARVIEVTLALAFIFAVLLNFANVVGRYLLGLSLLGADEVQIFIMVAMTFLGAAVVTRRNLHLRMDVLVRFLPAPVRMALRIAEQMLLAALAGFVLARPPISTEAPHFKTAKAGRCIASHYALLREAVS
jgi:TRAP-type C4-dicarboxylate transport system permease small subunit